MNTCIQDYIKWLGWVRVCPSLIVAAIVVTVPPGLASASAVEDTPPLVRAVEEALEAWSGFTVTGDVAGLAAAFVVGGPQHGQFVEESATWNGSRNPEPIRFGIRDLQVRSVGVDSATVWARVEAVRVGFGSQTFMWDFDLARSNGDWKVWTVVPASRPQSAPVVLDPNPPPRLTSTTTSTIAPPFSAQVEREATAAPEVEPSPRRSTDGVRLPALSAWIIVITIVGVAAAGYLAPRLERRE